MQSINTACYCAPIAGRLAKKNTETDIALYSHASHEGIFSFVEPVTYPEKVQSLFFPAMMSDICLLSVAQEWMDYRLGEAILTISAMGKNNGIAVLDDMVDESVFQRAVKDTPIEKYKRVNGDPTEIKAALSEFSIERHDGGIRILVDHSFEVKSVGTVVLGVVEQGEVKPYDELVAQPSGKKCMVKSIQMQDKPQQSAGAKSRVGLALKNASPDDVPRGTTLCLEGDMAPKTEFESTFAQNPFFRKRLPDNFIRACTSLQWKQVEAQLSRGSAKIKSESGMVAEPGQKIIFSIPGKPGEQRIVGWGEIK